MKKKRQTGVDFSIKSEPLTTADRKMISEYILKSKQKISKNTSTTNKGIKSKKNWFILK